MGPILGVRVVQTIGFNKMEISPAGRSGLGSVIASPELSAFSYI